jgi:hypothetical protein
LEAENSPLCCETGKRYIFFLGGGQNGIPEYAPVDGYHSAVEIAPRVAQ